MNYILLFTALLLLVLTALCIYIFWPHTLKKGKKPWTNN